MFELGQKLRFAVLEDGQVAVQNIQLRAFGLGLVELRLRRLQFGRGHPVLALDLLLGVFRLVQLAAGKDLALEQFLGPLVFPFRQVQLRF